MKIAPHGSTWHLFQDGTVDYAAFVRWLMTSETWRLRAKFANKQTLRFMSDQVFGYGWNRVCTVLIYWYFIYIYNIYIMYTVYSIPYIICMYSLDICTYVDTWLYMYTYIECGKTVLAHGFSWRSVWRCLGEVHPVTYRRWGELCLSGFTISRSMLGASTSMRRWTPSDKEVAQCGGDSFGGHLSHCACFRWIAIVWLS